MTQSKLKLVRNTDSEGVSLAIQNKGVNVGVLKHAPKHALQVKTPTKAPQFKIISKQVSASQLKTTKLINPTSKIVTITTNVTNATNATVATTPTTTPVKTKVI